LAYHNYINQKTESSNNNNNIICLSRSIQVDHQLFALTKLDMTGDGRDEIVACSWDGQTYILDQEKCSVRFQLEESVVSFCSGYYTLQPGQPPVPCLVYTTFTNKVIGMLAFLNSCRFNSFPVDEVNEPMLQVTVLAVIQLCPSSEAIFLLM
jgi:hypothetical protein